MSNTNNDFHLNTKGKPHLLSNSHAGKTEAIKEVILFGVMTLVILIIAIVGFTTKRVTIHWDENSQEERKNKKTSNDDIVRIVSVVMISTVVILSVAFVGNTL